MPQYNASGESCIRVDVNPGRLLQKTFILVAHPDDEAIGCGALLQRMDDPWVVFATDGAPKDPYFWKRSGSRAAYAEMRHAEALAALAEASVTRSTFLDIQDQNLHRHLQRALDELRSLIVAVQPQALLTHAYEGGHPDHDACAFLGEIIRRTSNVEVWEMPLYHRANGIHTLQTFIAGQPELVIAPTREELERKRRMTARYESQGLTTSAFDLEREVFRRQATYDFTQPPHHGTLNYEAWKWEMTGMDVCRSFSEFLATQNEETFAECH